MHAAPARVNDGPWSSRLVIVGIRRHRYLHKAPEFVRRLARPIDQVSEVRSKPEHLRSSRFGFKRKQEQHGRGDHSRNGGAIKQVRDRFAHVSFGPQPLERGFSVTP
jgi:hypothetical protein